MKYTEEQMKSAFDTLRSTSLSGQERASMKKTVVSFMKDNPLEVSPSDPDNKIIFSISESRWQAFSLRPLAVVLLTVVFGFGGVLLASENSLPDSSFYAVKTKVNEPLRGLFAVSPESKARWQQDLAERRVDEVIALTTTMRITPEQQIELLENFQKHVDRSREYATLAAEESRVQTTPQVLTTQTVPEAGSVEDDSLEVFDGQSATVAIDHTMQRQFVEKLKLQRELLADAPEVEANTEEAIALIDQEIATLDILSVEVLPVLAVEDVGPIEIFVEGEENETEVKEPVTIGPDFEPFEEGGNAIVIELPVATVEDEDTSIVLSSEQIDALEKLGVDLSEFPTELDATLASCFREKLGDERAESIFEGALLNLFDVLKVEVCVEEYQQEDVADIFLIPESEDGEDFVNGEENLIEEVVTLDEGDVEDESQAEMPQSASAEASILEIGLLGSLTETL